MSFDLVTLIDFEAQLSRDSGAAVDTLRKREGQIHSRILAKLTDKRTALLAWIRELKPGEGPWPGVVLVRGYDSFVFILFLAGFFCGVGSIQVFLRYDGSEPVNVIPIIAFYGFLQILLVLWYLLKSGVARMFRAMPGGALIALLRDFGARFIARRPHLFSVQNFDNRVRDVFLQRLKDVHSSLLISKAWQAFQVFGLAFHLASLGTFLLMIAFNDYTFAWRTTLQLEAGLFHQIVSALSLPFAWLSDFLHPTLSLIESSQFDRFQKGFVRGEALATKDWWPFLAAVIAVYGLLPRFLIWAWLKSYSYRYLRAYSPSDFQSEGLWQRLSEAQSGWTNESLEAPRAVPDQTLAEISRTEEKSCVLIVWRETDLPGEAVKDLLQSRFNFTVRSSMNAQGLAKESALIVESLKAFDSLVFVTDPFELPGEAIDKIRIAVRAKFPKALLLFAPLEKSETGLKFSGDKTAWTHALKIYRDPYLGLLENA